VNIKLDKIDLSILKDLQEDGRLTNVELAKRAGISAPPCLRRVKSLETEGIITSYQANLNGPALGFNLVIFAEVSLVSQNHNEIKSFEAQVDQWPLIRECYLVTGGSDFLLKLIVKDFEAYQEFLSTQLSMFPGVSQIKTLMVVRTAKKVRSIPLEQLTL
jgi:DNA-binding Lrp family transcriptional regulator